MRRRVFVGDFANQHHAQTDDQFGDRARVGIRRVENRHAFFVAAFKSTWFAPMQNTPMASSLSAVFENFFRDLRFRTNAEEMNAFDRFDQIFFADRAGNLLISA